MGCEEGGGKFACRNSAEARASKGPFYAGGTPATGRGDEATLGSKADSGAGKEAGPESRMR